MPKPEKKRKLSPAEEKQFQEFWSKDPSVSAWLKQLKGKNYSPESARAEADLDTSVFNYREAWLAGDRPQKNEKGEYHWSVGKGEKHPTKWKSRFVEKHSIDPDKLTQMEIALLDIASTAIPDAGPEVAERPLTPDVYGEYSHSFRNVMGTPEVALSPERYDPYVMETISNRIYGMYGGARPPGKFTARDSASVMAHELGHHLQVNDPETRPSFLEHILRKPGYEYQEYAANLRAMVLLNEAERNLKK